MDRWFRRAWGQTLARVAVVAFMLALLLGVSSSVGVSGPFATSADAAQPGPNVKNEAKHDTSPPLRNLKPKKTPPGKGQKEQRLGGVPKGKKPAQSGSGSVQTGVVTNAMPSFGQNFEGVGNVNGVLPPDTQGDVGPNHYIQMINLSFAIYSKQGNLLYGPVDNTTLWQNFGGPCETINGGDPITMYDENADRWFMSQLAYPGGPEGFHQCIAVSATPDPLGQWHRYDFLYDQTLLNDYPKFGIWRDAYFATANDFLNGQTFAGAGVQAYERAKMLNGQAAQVVTFHFGDSSGIYGNLLPADAEGGALGFNPPAGAPAPFIQFDDDAWGFSPTDRLLLWDFHVDWANPANSTFGVGPNHTPNGFIPVASFDSNLCNYARSCIPQPGTGVGLDAFGDRLLNRLAYRNFGGAQSLVVNHGVDVDGNDHAGLRWYQLANTGSGWTMDQQGTFAPDSDNRWMGSAAMDASGNLAIGYSVSSASTFPSIRVAGRLAGDPAGQLSQGETELIAGGGSQTHPASRWGDYASMQLDPTDGCTFWFTTEYLQQTSSADWRTRIGSFKFPNCTAGPHGDLTGTVRDSGTSQPIAGALVTTSAGTTTTDSQGHYEITLPEGAYDVTFSAFGYNPKTQNGVQITDGGTTTLNVSLDPAPLVNVTGTVTDGSGHGWPLYARIEITGLPGGAIYTNPVTGQYSVKLPANATYSAKVTADLPGYEVVTESIPVGSSDVVHDIEIPILGSCVAPGYRFNFTEALSQDFNSGTQPPGWVVTDEIGNGETWTFNDPGGRGNMTGGDGAFAIMDSDRLGPDHTQDTSLVTPTVDLSSAATPVVRFNEDYVQWFDDDFIDVDVSIDGGATWLNAFHDLSASRRGPRVTTVLIPQAAGQANVKVRWRYGSTFGFWWEVDNAFIGNRSCDPTPGGLVVGNVKDANTQNGVNGATVTSDDAPTDKGTTVATPNDPNNPDGYYWLFSSLTGSHPFTASKALYQSQTKPVSVAPDSAVRADFTLGAGQLVVSPTSITKSIVLGNSTTQALNIKNTGTAPANVTLAERKGSFQILTMEGAPLIKLRLNKSHPPAVGWLGANQVENVPGIDAGAPNDPTWSPIANYPRPIMDNAADQIDGKVYSVGGFDGGAIIPNAFAYDPIDGTWAAIASMQFEREKPGAGSIGGKLYATGGWDSNGNPRAQTEAYDPASNTWETVAPNPAPRAAPGTAVADDKLYLVGGCVDGSCTPSTNVARYDPAANSWDALAPYPHPISWLSCGGIDGKVYCAGGFAGGTAFTDGFVYDPAGDSWSPIAGMPINLWGSAYGAANGLLLVSSGLTGPSTLTNQGFSYDPGSDSWTALPNAQFPRFRGGGACGFYKLGGSSVAGFSPSPQSEQLSELDQCGVTDVPWLAENPTEATLAPGQSVNVVVTLSATTAAGVTQPGTYTAQIVVNANTPSKVDPIPVTMNVTPPKGWGKIDGTVTGTACNGTTAPLRGAQVQATGKNYAFSLKTVGDGKYAFWAPSASNPFTLIASKDGWIAQSKTASIKANKTTTVNFALQQAGC